MRESPYLAEIRRLDPVRDHLRIVYLDACFEFPFDVTRALELAFFRTFAVPSIAELLASTGEFSDRPLKRYDDTDILISSFVEEGYDSPTGRAAIRRMNQLHGRFAISNEDFLYVLSTLVIEPFRWNERFGWRRATDAERIATFEFWRTVAGMMNIRDVPPTYEQLEAYNVAFERERFAFTEAGHRVASAMVDMFVRKLPGVPLAVGRRGVYALLDDPLLDALGLPHPTTAERRAGEAALKLRARGVALMPPRRRPRKRTKMRRRKTYPQGWEIASLGPASGERLPSSTPAP
jgi:hypothetical protein